MTNADQNQSATSETPGRPFRDTSWQAVLRLLEREADPLEFAVFFRHMTAIEDTAALLLLDCETGSWLSSFSRRYVSQIYDALAILGRTNTVVRLRGSISNRNAEPDYVYRTLLRPGAPARPDDIEESAS